MFMINVFHQLKGALIACINRFRLIDWVLVMLVTVVLFTNETTLVSLTIEHRLQFILALIVFLQIISFRWIEWLVNHSAEKMERLAALQSMPTPYDSTSSVPELIPDDGPNGENGITILVGVRNRESTRLRNLLASLRRQTYPSDKIKILVIDYDSETPYNDAYRALCLKYDADLYRIDYRAVWCKAEAINSGLKHVKTQHCMIADVDIIYAPNYIETAVDALTEDPYRIIHSVVYETGLNIINENTDFDKDFYNILEGASPRGSDDSTSRYIYGQGIIAVCTDFLAYMHGLDERYYGWGCEDDDLIKRLKMLGLHMYSIADKAVYLHHSHPKFEGLSKFEQERSATNSIYLRSSQSIKRNSTSLPRIQKIPFVQVGYSSVAKEFVLRQKRQFISVIIPVFDKVALLKQCLEALNVQTFPSADFEIIVVNNGALEDVERIVNQYPQCRYVYEAIPGSYAARNAGIAHAKGEIVAFTDTDCIPSPNWLEKGHRYFFGPHKASYVAGRIQLRHSHSMARTLSEEYEMLFSYNQGYNWRVLGFGATANLFVRRAILEQVGKFNASLFSAGDQELGRKVRDLGVPCVYADDVMVEHPTTTKLASLLMRYVRYIGGDFDLRRARGINRTRIAVSLLFREIKSFFFFPRNIWNRTLGQSLLKRLGIIAVGVSIRLARCWELVQLWIGRASKRI